MIFAKTKLHIKKYHILYFHFILNHIISFISLYKTIRICKFGNFKNFINVEK